MLIGLGHFEAEQVKPLAAYLVQRNSEIVNLPLFTAHINKMVTLNGQK